MVVCGTSLYRRHYINPGTAIAQDVQFSSREGMRQGVLDSLRNWFLVLRCGGLGAILGATALPPAWLDELELRDVVEKVAVDLHQAFWAQPDNAAAMALLGWK